MDGHSLIPVIQPKQIIFMHEHLILSGTLAKMNKMDVFVGLQNKFDFNCCNIVSTKLFAWDYRQLVMLATLRMSVTCK